MPLFLIDHKTNIHVEIMGQKMDQKTIGKYDTTCVKLRVKLRINSQNGNKNNDSGIK